MEEGCRGIDDDDEPRANLQITIDMRVINEMKFDLVTLDTKSCRKEDVTSGIY